MADDTRQQAAPDLLSYESIGSDGRRSMDPWLAIAHTRRGLPPAWRWCRLECFGDTVLITGGVPRVISRGPRKGERTWMGCTTTTLSTTRAEQDDVQRIYSETTGRCHRCAGTGQEVASIGIDGTQYRACKICAGSGAAER